MRLDSESCCKFCIDWFLFIFIPQRHPLQVRVCNKLHRSKPFENNHQSAKSRASTFSDITTIRSAVNAGNLVLQLFLQQSAWNCKFGQLSHILAAKAKSKFIKVPYECIKLDVKAVLSYLKNNWLLQLFISKLKHTNNLFKFNSLVENLVKIFASHHQFICIKIICCSRAQNI